MALKERTRATSWLAFLMSIVMLGIAAVSMDAYSRAHSRQMAELSNAAAH